MIDEFDYGDLLARLRKDLQLDATTDLLPGTVTPAAFAGWLPATGPVGAVTKKLPVYDARGSLLGYVPIYGSIT